MRHICTTLVLLCWPICRTSDSHLLLDLPTCCRVATGRCNGDTNEQEPKVHWKALCLGRLPPSLCICYPTTPTWPLQHATSNVWPLLYFHNTTAKAKETDLAAWFIPKYIALLLLPKMGSPRSCVTLWLGLSRQRHLFLVSTRPRYKQR